MRRGRLAKETAGPLGERGVSANSNVPRNPHPQRQGPNMQVIGEYQPWPRCGRGCVARTTRCADRSAVKTSARVSACLSCVVRVKKYVHPEQGRNDTVTSTQDNPIASAAQLLRVRCSRKLGKITLPLARLLYALFAEGLECPLPFQGNPEANWIYVLPCQSCGKTIAAWGL